MLTELWESDAFTERKETLIDTIETEYHWSKGDIIVATRGGERERPGTARVTVRRSPCSKRQPCPPISALWPPKAGEQARSCPPGRRAHCSRWS